MKKIFALAVAVIMTVALFAVAASAAKSADQWLCDTDPATSTPATSTGWWFNPVGDPDDRYVTISFTAKGNFSGIKGYYLCSPNNDTTGPAVMTVQLLQGENVVAEKQIDTDGDAWYETDFGKTFGAGAYSLKYTCHHGKGVANEAWFVLGSANGSDDVEIIGNVPTNENTLSNPAVMLIGAEAGSSASTGSKAALTVNADKIYELFETSPATNTVTAEKKDGYVTFTAQGDDPWFNFAEPLNPGADAKYAVVKYRTSNEGVGTVDFYLQIAEPHARESVVADGNWNYVVIDMSVPYPDNMQSIWAGTIARFDPMSGSVTGASIDIASFEFYTSEADARAAASGRTNPATADASVIAVAAVACVALAGVVVAKKVR